MGNHKHHEDAEHMQSLWEHSGYLSEALFNAGRVASEDPSVAALVCWVLTAQLLFSVVRFSITDVPRLTAQQEFDATDMQGTATQFERAPHPARNTPLAFCPGAMALHLSTNSKFKLDFVRQTFECGINASPSNVHTSNISSSDSQVLHYLAGKAAPPNWIFAMVSATPTLSLEHHLFHRDETAGPSSSITPASGGHKLQTGAIAAIAVGIVSILLLTLGLLLGYRRRRTHSRDAAADKRVDLFEQLQDDDTTLAAEALHPYPILYPDIAPVAGREAVEDRTKARRAYLQNELRAAQEKIAHIQSQSTQVHAPRTLVRFGTGRGSQGESETVAQLREQNATYEARIRQLEAEMMSPWALGLSDELPPGYEEGVGSEV
ncbi:hypothetical protein FB45DRAFT_875435 [Roridomyces roridus]|uniref:Uncharacterized protein n=1 Tax=Roridomyces roridus TaxID=1738132 RepID=A0AAD7B657_9AGAR|nr:hypothetical protein FB45DRAFT_875435 [Roridomyces roridus]